MSIIHDINLARWSRSNTQTTLKMLIPKIYIILLNGLLTDLRCSWTISSEQFLTSHLNLDPTSVWIDEMDFNNGYKRGDLAAK